MKAASPPFRQPQRERLLKTARLSDTILTNQCLNLFCCSHHISAIGLGFGHTWDTETKDPEPQKKLGRVKEKEKQSGGDEVKINAESRTFYTEVTHFDTECQTPVVFHLHLRH